MTRKAFIKTRKTTSYQLSPRTIELCETLLIQVPWFSKIGQPLDAPHAARKVESLRKAIKLFGSVHWDDTLLEAKNGVTECIFARDQELLKKWNDIVYAFDNAYADRFLALYERLTGQYGLPPKHWMRFRGIIVNSCQESEYIDVLPLGFFSEIISWYMTGYFPCGFDGEYPNGTLLVY